MTELMKQLWKKHKDVIPYAFFGVATTVVNVVGYWLTAHLLGFSVMFSTVVAWILAVLFAYVTNRKWVFKSYALTSIEIMREMSSFFACRLATGIVDWAAMFVFVDVVGMDDVIVKAAANIVVIVLNYIASKMVIFKER